MPHDSPSFGLKLRFNGKPGIYRCTWSTWWPLVSCTMSSFNGSGFFEMKETAPKGGYFLKSKWNSRWPNFFRTFKHSEFGWIWRLVKHEPRDGSVVFFFFTVWVGVAVGRPFGNLWSFFLLRPTRPILPFKGSKQDPKACSFLLPKWPTLGVGFKDFYFHLYLRRWPNLTSNF